MSPFLTAKHLTCGRCRLIKAATEFPRVKQDGRAYCTDCRQAARLEANRQERSSRRDRMRRLRGQVVEAFGGRCECHGCLVTTPEFMTITHAFDRNDRKIYSVEEATLRPCHFWELMVKKRFPRDRYRMLCHNCKTARQQDGACPCEDLDVG